MNNSIKKNICLLWHRLGPYHYARFRATSKQGPVLGVEFSGLDSTYAWKKVNPSRLDNVVTLFPGRDSQTVPPDEINGKVSSVLTAQKPSAVFIPGWSDKTALAALRWCLTQGVPAVVMSPSQEADAPRNCLKEWIKKRVVRLFSGGLAGGSPQKRYLESLGIPKDRILTGYNVIDNAHFEKGARRARRKTAKYRKLLGLPEKYFICSTRFVPKKNLDRLIRAYSRYLQAGLKKEWSLVLLGDGTLRPKLETLIDQLGLKGKVLMPGFKQYDELPHYYALAQALVLPSVSEQWGLVVNEAMACGLPVLVSDRCGCAEDLVEKGKNGFTFDPFDLNSITQALVKITQSESLLPRMGSRSRQIIRAWSPSHFAKQVWALTGMEAKTFPPKPDWIDHLILGYLSRKIMTGYQDR
jgi:1,2-diacylglycerol 3-alpha-glucosyltransferase